jgi:hypothetical protein
MTAIATIPRYSEKQFDSTTRAKVRKITVKENRESLKIQADCILFVNRGQNILLIDEQVVLMPGGFFKERNVVNDYAWRFITNPTPPVADGVLVVSGNHVVVRILNGDGQSDVNSDIDFMNPAKIDTGDITVETAPPVPTAMVAVNDTITTDLGLPAGIIRGKIKNLGGELSANITVNGQELAPGDEYPLGAFYAGNILYLPPAYNVVANGSQWSYYYEK